MSFTVRTRREILKWGSLLAAYSFVPFSRMGAQQVEKSKRGTGPLKITKVEPVITSSPMIDGPLSEAVEMPPLGSMTNQVGIRNRLNPVLPRFRRNPAWE